MRESMARNYKGIIWDLCSDGKHAPRSSAAPKIGPGQVFAPGASEIAALGRVKEMITQKNDAKAD